MNIRNKLKLGVSLIFLLALALSWLFISNIGEFQRQSLLAARFEQLVSLRESLASHIKDYQKTTILALETIAHDRTVQDALSILTKAYQNIAKNNTDSNKAADLKAYYQQHYISRINTQLPNTKAVRKIEEYLPQSASGLALQHHFLLSDKQSNSGFESYLSAHQQYHNYLSPLIDLHGFYDLFLIDAKGNIVYSVLKEADLGTNLLTGPYKQSGLAEAYRASRKINGKKIAHSPYQAYEPSYNLPASFIAMPIYKGAGQGKGSYLGSVVVQLPIEPINNIMTFNGHIDESGLGDSGEIYIVGNDSMMRNDSRFIRQSSNPLVQELGTTIGIQAVNTEAIKKARSGNKGTGIFEDYRGQQVLSAYQPIQLFGEKAVITAEIDYQTVVSSINATVDKLMLKIITGMVLLWAFVLIFFKQLLLNPLRKVNRHLEKELLEQEHQVIVSRSLLNEYKKAVDASAIVSKTNNQGSITYINDAFCEISSYSRRELIGKNHNIVRSTRTPDKVYADLWGTIKQKRIWKGIICNISKSGTEYYLSSTIVPILTIHGEIYEYIAIGTDVTELFLRQEEILLHTIDSLTQLPNRQKFLQNLANSRLPRLAIININHFSEVNDFYGYDIGDALLVQIAELITRLANQDLAVFRLSGDEFGLLASDDFSSEKFAQKCIQIIEELDNTIFSIQNNELNISTTMGVAEESNNVYVNAGMALRVAKESQKKYLFYNSNVDIQRRTGENLRWTKMIKQAIDDDRIELYIQPIINRSTQSVDKYECLMRLIDEENNEISPFFFINTAKHARLYPKLSEIIIKKSFAYFANRTESFSINLTIIDILNDDIIKLLKQLIREKSIAERVVLEIVESEGIDNFEQISEFIQDMQSLGCRIAIDDFGTGYSNFEYLMKLDPDFIKIDGSIIKNITHDEGVYAVTKLIHDFASSIGAKTIAEFVCDQAISLKLDEIGIDYLQGYHFGRPTLATNKPAE